MSKTSKIIKLRDQILQLVGEYAMCAADWEPKAEGDYDSFVNSLEELLEEVVE